MFDVTGDDISLLSPPDLRELVGRLCEAELRRRGLSRSFVTWGGDQSAPDGGLDVRVDLDVNTAIDGFIPRPRTGFQVKREDYPPSKITPEMRPDGTLRNVIKDLAKGGGAYIIVSSQGTTADFALRNRRDTMLLALGNDENRDKLYLDFYDRTRLATWLRDHAGLIPWVREKIGKSLHGWKSYGAWASSPQGEQDTFLIDNKIRIRTAREEDDRGLSALVGISRIRRLLARSSNVVRIVGLSGVGKTRLAQALFDSRLEGDSLDPSLAIYTNIAEDPDPQPTRLVGDLIASNTRAILVIDNCPPELHGRLTKACKVPGSTVSIVTIEYDIRDDEPESTDVFKLEPSSPDLVQRIIQIHNKDISEIDARTIADFSGGNARIALALARTVQATENITGLSDQELFRRLFEQRHEHNESLFLTAQACSLVYSFQADDAPDSPAELPGLASIVGQTKAEAYRNVSELLRRDLAQRRGVWRAVLPHAVANRLAQLALQNVEPSVLKSHFESGKSNRLILSFSRRLGFLDSSKEARSIVERWLSPEGLLGDVSQLNELGRTILTNIAPVSPSNILASIERALDSPSDSVESSLYSSLSRLIRSLAYDPDLFQRAAIALSKLAGAGEAKGEKNEPLNALRSLFTIYLSGTHAPLKIRLEVVKHLLAHSDPAQRDIGIRCLRSLLKAANFSGGYSFEFGARSRDYGYWPKSFLEVRDWFVSSLAFAEDLACSDSAVRSAVRTAIADRLREIWTYAEVYDDIERVVRRISATGFWLEGWIAVRQTIRYGLKKQSQQISDRLRALEIALRPSDVAEEIRAVISTRIYDIALDSIDGNDGEDPSTHLGRADSSARLLGEQVAADEKLLNSLLPELVRGQGLTFPFGQGLASGTHRPDIVWQELMQHFIATPPRNRNVQILRGFLQQLKETSPEKVSRFLEASFADNVTAAYYPALETSSEIDASGIQRLRQSLTLGKVPVRQYQALAYGRSADSIPSSDLSKLLEIISSKDEGFSVAVEILAMRLFSENNQKLPKSPDLIISGRRLLEAVDFDTKEDRQDYNLARIAQYCLEGTDAAQIVRAICEQLRSAHEQYWVTSYDYEHLIRALFMIQPRSALDGFFAGTKAEQVRGLRFLKDDDPTSNPTALLPESELFAWCNISPKERYPIAAAISPIFEKRADKAPPVWSSVSMRILEDAPDRVAVLKQLARRIRPTSWTGSLSATLETRLPLLASFDDYPDPAVRQFAHDERERLNREVERERQNEAAEDRARDRKFE